MRGIRPSLLLAGLAGLGAMACGSDAANESGSEAAAAPDANPFPGEPALQRQLELMGELRAINQALAPIRARTQQEAQVQAQEQALMAQVDAAMEDISPGVLEARARFDTLRAEYASAQQAGEQERLQPLETELRELQIRIRDAESAALAQEDVAEAIESFRETLFARMRESDPQADSLLERGQEIANELQSMAPAADR